MFHTLDEEIKRTQGRMPAWHRLLQYAGVFCVSAALFGALYLVVLFVE